MSWLPDFLQLPTFSFFATKEKNHSIDSQVTKRTTSTELMSATDCTLSNLEKKSNWKTWFFSYLPWEFFSSQKSSNSSSVAETSSIMGKKEFLKVTPTLTAHSEFSGQSLLQQLSTRKSVHDFKASEHFYPLANGLLSLLEGKKPCALENIFYDKKTKMVSVPQFEEDVESIKRKGQTPFNFQHAAILLTELAAGEYAAKELKAYLAEESRKEVEGDDFRMAISAANSQEKETRKAAFTKEENGAKNCKRMLEDVFNGIPLERATIITRFITISETKEEDEKLRQQIITEIKRALEGPSRQ